MAHSPVLPETSNPSPACVHDIATTTDECWIMCDRLAAGASASTASSRSISRLKNLQASLHFRLQDPDPGLPQRSVVCVHGSMHDQWQSESDRKYLCKEKIATNSPAAAASRHDVLALHHATWLIGSVGIKSKVSDLPPSDAAEAGSLSSKTRGGGGVELLLGVPYNQFQLKGGSACTRC